MSQSRHPERAKARESQPALVTGLLHEAPAFAGMTRLLGRVMILTRYERMIARRYLLPGKGEGFIFLVAGISLAAVMLGVAGADRRDERDERLPRRAVRQGRRASTAMPWSRAMAAGSKTGGRSSSRRGARRASSPPSR